MSRSLIPRLLFAGETIVLTLIVVVGLQTFVAQPYRVEHGSMLDTLEDGEMVLVDKLSPHLGGLARGDIVVFEPPPREGDDGTPFIKRVIGLPGEEVRLEDGRVLIDGVALDESGYVYRDQPTLPTDGVEAWQVPAGRLFVLGDHRIDSTDSRMTWLGTIAIEQVVGRAAVSYWPVEAATVLSAPAYPELQGAAAASGDQAGPTTQLSIARP